MTEEEKFSPDSISLLGSVSSADFNCMWEDYMGEFCGVGTFTSDSDVLVDGPPAEASTSSGLKFEEVPLKCFENSSDYHHTDQNDIATEEFSLPGPSCSSGVTPVASLVATNNWQGDYGFNIHFEEPKQLPSKGANWIYSSKQDKLYVKKDVACPIKFETNQQVTCDARIKAMAVFEDTRYASDVVQRCSVHYKQDEGMPHAKHVIKCECDQARYEEEPVTNRLSVSVQYENPQSGEKYSTYIFKFTCLGSCPGGINRRPIKVIFTLECGCQTIGRRVINVRICACPRRDIANDEKRLFGVKEENKGKNGKNRKRKRPKGDDEHSDTSFQNFTGGQSKKARVDTAPRNGPAPYYVKANDRKQYRFLKQMQKLYLMYAAFPEGPPHLRESFLNSLTTSSESSSMEEMRETDESDC